MSRRYEYARITGADLSRRLGAVQISAEELVRYAATSRDRVMKWLDGREDIPPSIDLLTTILAEMPEALDIAERWASRVAVRKDRC